MILWKSNRSDGGVLIGIGLEAGNIEKLKQGHPILRDLNAIGYFGATLAVIYGETKEAMIEDLKKHGVVVAEGPPPPIPGATGAFPKGKLSPDDEGELAMVMTRVGDMVRFDFGKELSWVSMSTNEAKEFAARIMKIAGQTKDS